MTNDEFDEDARDEHFGSAEARIRLPGQLRRTEMKRGIVR